MTRYLIIFLYHLFRYIKGGDFIAKLFLAEIEFDKSFDDREHLYFFNYYIARGQKAIILIESMAKFNTRGLCTLIVESPFNKIPDEYERIFNDYEGCLEINNSYIQPHIIKQLYPEDIELIKKYALKQALP